MEQPGPNPSVSVPTLEAVPSGEEGQKGEVQSGGLSPESFSGENGEVCSSMLDKLRF